LIKFSVNIFLNTEIVHKTKNVKNKQNMTEIKKLKTFITSKMLCMWSTNDICNEEACREQV